MKETARGPEVPAQVLTIAIRDRSKIPMQIEFHFGVIEDNSWTRESVVLPVSNEEECGCAPTHDVQKRKVGTRTPTDRQLIAYGP